MQIFLKNLYFFVKNTFEKISGSVIILYENDETRCTEGYVNLITIIIGSIYP